MKELPLFQGLNASELRTALTALGAKEKHYAKGQLLCRYEGNQTMIGMLAEGSVQILRYDGADRKMVLEWLQAGDVFGEALAFPCGFEREEETFLVSMKATTVLYIHYEKLTTLCSEGKNGGIAGALAANWNAVLTKKAAAFARRLEILSCRSIREKLLCYFSILAKEQGGRHFSNCYTMTETADYLCVDRSAMVRELGVMRDEGLIKIEKKDVILL